MYMLRDAQIAVHEICPLTGSAILQYLPYRSSAPRPLPLSYIRLPGCQWSRLTALFCYSLQAEGQLSKRVWSDYPLLSEHLALEDFEFTEDRAVADIIISSTPIRDFRSLPR